MEFSKSPWRCLKTLGRWGGGGGGGIGDTSHTHLCRQIIDLVFNENLSSSESLSKPESFC